MINKTAFMALSLIMVVSWAFGAVCDRMITRWFNSLSKPQETPERRSCDNCKHKDKSWYEEPCDECSCGDNWEADK